MGPEAALVLAFALFILFLAIGVPVPFGIAIPGLLYLYMQGGVAALNSIGMVTWGSMNSFILTAIPLFVLMAEILERSGVSERVYQALSVVVARIPGGLLQTNIAGCAIFSAISGSSVATAATIGGVALPQILSRGYDRRLAVGSIAAGGTLGNLIPPSIVLVIYGAFTETSVAKLFIACIVPGLILTAMYMGYIALRCTMRPELAPKERFALSLAGTVRTVIDLTPFALLIVVTLGSIYAGWATPTEAAAAGCVMCVAVACFFGNFSMKVLIESLDATILLIGNILFLVFAAFIFSFAISFAGVGEALTAWIVNLGLEKWEFYLALFALFTVLGCLVEALGMIVITVPLLFPVLKVYGIDPIWFGVVLVLFVELGSISPPIGINLFVIQGLWDGKLGEVVLGSIPFHLIALGLLAMLAIWPEMALWLTR